MAQEEGLIGKAVGGMIRRSVRKTFHSVLWSPPDTPLKEPVILVANHHGWHDGYLMYHAITKLGIQCVDWIAEFDTFPLFAKIGGMPFPPGDAGRRAATIRKTVRLMKEGRSLILFSEGRLHFPPDLLPFGKALDVLAKQIPNAQIVPVAIKYEMALHERPQAFLLFGKPVEPGEGLVVRTRDAVQALLAEATFRIRHEPESFQLLAKGKDDFNERWDRDK